MICQAANALIGHNKSRIPKLTCSVSCEDGWAGAQKNPGAADNVAHPNTRSRVARFEERRERARAELATRRAKAMSPAKARPAVWSVAGLGDFVVTAAEELDETDPVTERIAQLHDPAPVRSPDLCLGNRAGRHGMGECG